MSIGHYIWRCPHGVIIRQCRCIGPKVEMIVPCDGRLCASQTASEPSKPQNSTKTPETPSEGATGRQAGAQTT